jgi:hypothetical protein
MTDDVRLGYAPCWAVDARGRCRMPRGHQGAHAFIAYTPRSVEERAAETHARIVASGQALDLRAAHARCFEGGNSGTVAVRGF